eukprot:389173_1
MSEELQKPHLDVFLWDEVFLVDKAIGIVKFIGEVKGKEGVFYGIDLKKGKGKNKGCIKNRRYFRTRNNKQSGRFTQITKIISRTKTPKSLRVTIGDTIQCPQLNTRATIRYAGIPQFDKTMKTVYYGIELAHPKGDCNGEIYSAYLGKKISYFRCESSHGLYIKSNDVTLNYVSSATDNTEDTDQKTMEIAIATQQQAQTALVTDDHSEKLQTIQGQYDRLFEEYNDYKQEFEDIERDKHAMHQVQESNTLLQGQLDEHKQEMQQTEEANNELQQIINRKTDQMERLKQQVDRLQHELDEANANRKEAKESEDETEPQVTEDVSRYKVEIERLKQQNKTLRMKYDATKQTLQGLTGSNNNESVQMSTEYLEQELAQLKVKQNRNNNKQRISGVLTKFASQDINTSLVILKEILKQWDSAFISNNSRIEHLRNFE